MLRLRLVFYFMLASLSVDAQALLGVSNSKNAPEGEQLPNSTHVNSGEDLYNVDLYTGIGNTIIPIYDYQVDGLDLGVSLSYSNKGIRVDDVSSSIGLGWEIQAGGGIDRMAQGLEDEFTIPSWDGFSIMGPWVDTTISGHRDFLYDMFTANLGGRTVKFAMEKYNGFVYTMPKSELKVYARHKIFYFMTNGIWPQFGTAANDTTNFVIVDEKGNSFYFIQGDQNRRITEGYKSKDTLYVSNRFVLWQVITHTGKIIKFNYRHTNVNYVLYKEEKVWESLTQGFKPEINDIRFDGYISELTDIEYPNGVKVYFNTDDQNHARCDLPGGAVLSSIKVEGAYDNDVKHSITYRLNHSYFNTANSFDTRTEVPHRTPCDDLVVSAKDRHQDIFGTRLKLNSIDRLDSNGSGERFFTFDYHPSPLPKRLSPQRDYYGYANNGVVTPLTVSGADFPLSIPRHTIIINILGNPLTITYGTDRSPDTTNNLDYLQACILRKITNGQGGEIEFKYKKPVLDNLDPTLVETNYGYKTDRAVLTGVIDQDKFGRDATDGLVVYQIIKKDGVSSQHTTITQYDYTDGQRFNSGGYFWKPVLCSDAGVFNVLVVNERQYFNFFLSPQPFLRGSNHGFSTVTITVLNQYTSERLSKKVYSFSNMKNPTDLSTLFDPSNIFTYNPNWPGSSNVKQETGLLYHTAYVRSFNTLLMGLLKSEAEYDVNDQLVSSRVNKYHSNTKHADGLPHSMAVQNGSFTFKKPCPQPGCDTTFSFATGGLEGGGEGIQSAIWRITNTTVTNYSGNTESSIKYNYTYDYRDNLKTITWTDSKNQTYRKEFDYTYDRLLCTHCTPDSVQHRIVERLVKVDVGNAANNRIINTRIKVPHPYTEKNMTIFPYPDRNNIKPDLLAYKRICQVRFPFEYEVFIDTPVRYDSLYLLSEQKALEKQLTSIAPFERAKEFMIYDSSGNVVQTRIRNSQIYNSCIWDSVTNKKIAEISNAQFNETAYTGFEGLTHDASDLCRGNWMFSPARVIAPVLSANTIQALGGRYVYQTQSHADTIISTYALVPGKEYRLSLWATMAPDVFLGNTSVNLALEMQLQGGWRLYSATIVGDGNRIKIKHRISSTTFDEIRLHPLDASMKTWSYMPLLGVTTAIDEYNNITHYEYDMQGRPTIVRDINGHIRSQQRQVNQGLDN